MRVKDWASLWARLRSATAGGTERGPGGGLDVHAGALTAEEAGSHPQRSLVTRVLTGSRGDQVASWLQANAGQLNIKYIIWKQRIWMPGGSWKPMEDRGDPTQNHLDHVHVSVY